MITPEILDQHNVTPEEYERIKQLMGREPNLTELGIFSVMWSEHCSYKSSKVHLRRLPTEGECLVQGPGENAGIVDIGGGWCAAFKIESHNHPSFIEPYQGAATGVGGILRDIFTMGARPVAAMNSLRFGPIRDEDINGEVSRGIVLRNRRIMTGVVKGIGDYGNCLTGDEGIVIKENGKTRWLTIGEFCDRFASGLPEASLEIDGFGIQALSFDETARKPVWSLVRRVFKRQAERTLNIKTRKGRALRVSPDHPMLACFEKGWQTVLAKDLVPGSKIPILTSLPGKSDSVSTLDLIELLCKERPDIWVSYALPVDLMPAAMVEMRGLVSRADCRYGYRETGRYPLPVYLALEERFGLDRRKARLLLRSGKANYVPAVIDIDGDFARLLGYYLAERCTSTNGATDKIIWVFGKNEHDDEYVADLCRILDRYDLRYSVRDGGTSRAVWLSSWFLGALFRKVLKIGSNAYEKAIPAALENQPPAVMDELLKGLFRGDGSLIFYSPEKGSRARMCWATISRRLFEQVLLQLQARGIVPAIYTKPERKTLIRDRIFTCRPAYYLEFHDYVSMRRIGDLFSTSLSKKLKLEMDATSGTQYSFPRHTQRDGYAELQVTEIHELNSPATVYDLEVEDTHNFVTSGGIITHNCFGIPTVGGEVSFAECYSLNPLVNAFALGLVRREHIFYGKAEGIGNAVIYVGAKTGRDGIHGATMASAEFDEAAMEKRPTVQVGDPFSEKLLLEACLEAMRAGAIVGIQDMGAAGLTSSSCEMGARAGTGLEIDLDLVPQREAGMTAYEMMLSESQERMLIVAKRGHDRQLMEIFHRWDLDAVVIGQVIAEQRLRVLHKGEVVADIPNKALTDEAPRYNRPQRPFAVSTEDVTPKIEAVVSNLKSQAGGESQVFTEILRRLVASPNLASKRWVYRQYDHMVRTNTVVLPGSDAAALRVKETRRSLAMSLDCNGRYCHLNPREGAKLAVAEAARNVVCSGARPLAITNCLNFASPERQEVMWAFSETIDGLAEACRALGTPVTGGNVSFYNETEGEGVYPTPVIGMLGLIEDARHTTTQWFKEAGDVILLLGVTRNDLGASELLSAVAGEASGAVPSLDLEAEKAVQKVCLEAIQAGLVRSAHDCSDGGLAVALAESCFSSYRRDAIGARIDLSEHAKLSGLRLSTALLFGESPSRIIISLKPERVSEVKDIARRAGVACSVIGEAGGEELIVACDGEQLIEASVVSLEEAWRNALPSHLDRLA